MLHSSCKSIIYGKHDCDMYINGPWCRYTWETTQCMEHGKSWYKSSNWVYILELLLVSGWLKSPFISPWGQTMLCLYAGLYFPFGSERDQGGEGDVEGERKKAGKGVGRIFGNGTQMIHLQRAESQQTCPCSALEAVCFPVASVPPQSTVVVSGRGGGEGKLYTRNAGHVYYFSHACKEWIEALPQKRG